MTLLSVDTFEPWYARAILPASALAIIIGSFLLIRAVIKALRNTDARSNSQATLIIGSILVVMVLAALTSSVTYHFTVRVPHVAEYEARNRSSHVVRAAANAQFRYELALAIIALSLPISACLISRHVAKTAAKPQPNSG